MALVTGAKRGIGRAIALALAEAGHDVIVNDLHCDDVVKDTLAALEACGAQARFAAADIGRIADHAALVDEAFSAFGRLDVLVNNAGISVRQRGDMLDVAPEDFDELMAVNLRGPFFLTQRVARRWLGEAARGPRTIINISSANARLVAIDRAEYCLSKTGVAMMTKLFAVRLADAGIGVFEIRPGIIRTDMTAVVKARYDTLIAGGITPVRRWGEPRDVGEVAVALASGQFHFSTGEAIHVDGGLHIARL